MSGLDTTSAEFFEAKYAGDADPWNFEGAPYEQQRYQTILAALAPNRYHHAWEPGCSIGIFTAQLAMVCDRVDACDLSDTAVSRAGARCAALPGVQVRCGSLTDNAPIADYNLIVLSEIGYYFTLNDWRLQVDRIVDSMQSGATLLAAHWLGHSSDHILSGDAVHDVLSSQVSLQHEHGERYPEAEGGFRLDRWRRI